MAKFGKKLTDDQMLEGGGAGMGRYQSPPKKSYNPDSEAEKAISLGFGLPLGVAGIAELATKKSVDPEDMRKSLKYEKEKREAADEIKRETRGMAKGGSASARADGCATKGKTKGRFV